MRWGVATTERPCHAPSFRHKFGLSEKTINILPEPNRKGIWVGKLVK